MSLEKGVRGLSNTADHPDPHSHNTLHVRKHNRGTLQEKPSNTRNNNHDEQSNNTRSKQDNK